VFYIDLCVNIQYASFSADTMDKRLKLHHLIDFFGKEASQQIAKGETLLHSKHVLSDTDLNLLKGRVKASQRNIEYSVTVRFILISSLLIKI